MESPGLTSPQVQQLISAARGDGHFENAWKHYRELVFSLAHQFDAPRMLEVGGGRTPMFDLSEITSLGADYTVNDIDPGELDRAPQQLSRLPGDIADPQLLGGREHDGTYDLIFSHMVFEHVQNPRDGYQNIQRLLAPGGFVVNFVPTLYATPFIINRLLPDRMSARILRAVFPNRNDAEIPKFPAFYRWCTSTSRTARKIADAGFRQVQIVPFYGHDYYAKIPILRSGVRRSSRLAERRNWRKLSSYAFVVAEGSGQAG